MRFGASIASEFAASCKAIAGSGPNSLATRSSRERMKLDGAKQPSVSPRRLAGFWIFVIRLTSDADPVWGCIASLDRLGLDREFMLSRRLSV